MNAPLSASEKRPLVTCLCLTKNRRNWLPKAIDCYQSQTYENREMLVVASGVDVADIIAAANDSSIRLLETDPALRAGRSDAMRDRRRSRGFTATAPGRRECHGG